MSNDKKIINLAALEGREMPQRAAKRKPVMPPTAERPQSILARLTEIDKQRELLKDHPERLAHLDELESNLRVAHAAANQAKARKEGN